MTNTLPQTVIDTRSLSTELTPEKAVEVASMLKNIENQSALYTYWRKGQWFNLYDEDKYKTDIYTPPSKQDICRKLGWSLTEIHRAARIVRMFGLEPNKTLKWSHYRYAYGIGGAKKCKGWIAAAIKHNWSSIELKKRIYVSRLASLLRKINTLNDKAKIKPLTAAELEQAETYIAEYATHSYISIIDFEYLNNSKKKQEFDTYIENFRKTGSLNYFEIKALEVLSTYLNITIPVSIRAYIKYYKTTDNWIEDTETKKDTKKGLPCTDSEAWETIGLIKKGSTLYIKEETLKVLYRYYSRKWHPDTGKHGASLDKMACLSAAKTTITLLKRIVK